MDLDNAKRALLLATAMMFVDYAVMPAPTASAQFPASFARLGDRIRGAAAKIATTDTHKPDSSSTPIPPANWTSAPDAAAFSKSSDISLLQAINVAEKSVPGRAVHAAFRTEQGRGLFDVEVLADKTLHEITIDAKADKADSSRVAGSLDSISPDQKKNIEAALAGTIDIEGAVARADALGYWAVDVGVVAHEGKPAYRVDLFKDGKQETVTVDPVLAKVVTSSR